jgi:transcriptional regulator with XRE-family HTH domain
MDDDKRHAQELAKLGRAIRETRERRGLSEREVADAVRGVSLAGVRAIEAGERPRLNYAEIILLSRLTCI